MKSALEWDKIVTVSATSRERARKLAEMLYPKFRVYTSRMFGHRSRRLKEKNPPLLYKMFMVRRGISNGKIMEMRK